MKSRILIGAIVALFVSTAATAAPMNCCRDCCKHMAGHHMSSMRHK